MCKTISPFFYYSELKRYEHKKSFIGHQYLPLRNVRATGVLQGLRLQTKGWRLSIMMHGLR